MAPSLREEEGSKTTNNTSNTNHHERNILRNFVSIVEGQVDLYRGQDSAQIDAGQDGPGPHRAGEQLRDVDVGGLLRHQGSPPGQEGDDGEHFL